LVEVIARAVAFYRDESCGKCTPCREGTRRMHHILSRIVRKSGRAGDLERLETLAQHVRAASFCGLGQSAALPVLATLRHFRDEYTARIPARAGSSPHHGQ
ncbi:MAG: NADH-ubiquinone oxidoreductase-F iron-sulfur binding region domain-containing protein, partial [Armatimonadota bacterium]|nr:NADH-ubiquinone oxidoreductase-F iron-sulfur binding region domain-containing protein [Armatimonadota bacterium]